MAIESWDAWELGADGSLASAHVSFVPNDGGWLVRRNDDVQLKVGTGYTPLTTISCGVCATDLNRIHLPFPLPQVLGHEVLARDEAGHRFVIDINASCLALGHEDRCDLCLDGLPTHCRRRLTLGINQLPGGFGAAVLVPIKGVYLVPDELPDDTAVLMEPFAAALNAADSIEIQPGDEIAVLGPKRLGMLAIAALVARRRESGLDFKIRAIVRRDPLGELALSLGADSYENSRDAELTAADVVIDTSGNPDALLTAISLARRELHLKSTHGQGAAGLQQLTAFVVDEMDAMRAPADSSDDLRFSRMEGLALEPTGDKNSLIVTDDNEFDQVLRPREGEETSWLRPRGRLLLDPTSRFSSPMLRAITERGLKVTSSRCGDFEEALRLLNSQNDLRVLGATLISHRFKRSELAEAMACARSDASLKVVVE